MKLEHAKIPPEFLTNIPEGMKLVHRGSEDFLVLTEVQCPNGHSLMSKPVHIHGEPSVRIHAETGGASGTLYIDAFWGGHKKLYDFIPVFTAAHPYFSAYCPKCEESLIVSGVCPRPECTADLMIQFLLPDGKSRILACARLGCPYHHVDMASVPQQVMEQVDDINFFGSHGERDVFGGI